MNHIRTTLFVPYLLELSLGFLLAILFFFPFPAFLRVSFTFFTFWQPNTHSGPPHDDDPSDPIYSFEALEGDPSHPNCQIKNIIFDLGDVLFRWSASSPESPLCPKTLKQILHSAVWFDYERGNISEDEAYARVADQFNLATIDVVRAFEAARNSLRSDQKMLEIIRGLKASGKAIFAMSNISAPDWEVLKTKADPSDWALFDMVFTSAEACERKPNVGFYQHVFTLSGIDPKQTIFVDDKPENVLTAQSFGVHGIVFDNVDNLVRQLKNLCEDPIERAWSFLQDNKKHLTSVTSNGVVLRENFAQLLIIEATGDSSLVDFVDKHHKFFNFFDGSRGILTTENFPNDLDTTSIGLTVLQQIESHTKHEVMDEMLRFRNKDGIIQVYFDHSRPRIDPVVCLNVLTLFYNNGRGHELEATLDWVERVLVHRAYAAGTLYYATAETFLFFLARLMQIAPPVHQRLGRVFAARVVERFGMEGDSLALAMRIIAAASIGLVDRPDFERLLSMQQENGSWTQGWIYKYGSSGLLIGNDGVTTALAIQAVKSVSQLRATK